jgi:hydrogenase nickel incorporation protein HypB
MNIPIVQNVLKANDELAAINRSRLHAAGLASIDIIGAPGSGKTALLQATLPRLLALRCGVIVGDLATQRDADRLAPVAAQVVQINTGRGCHLEANHVHEALDQLDLGVLDLLFIENVGNLICPVGFDLGQTVKVGVFSVAGGDDKAAKHPYLIHEADVLIVTMIDLLPHVSFDLDRFTADAELLNPATRIMRLSAKTGDGMYAWIDYVRAIAETERAAWTDRDRCVRNHPRNN